MPGALEGDGAGATVAPDQDVAVPSRVSGRGVLGTHLDPRPVVEPLALATVAGAQPIQARFGTRSSSMVTCACPPPGVVTRWLVGTAIA